MEFIRQYRKSANTLHPLIKYFQKYGQKHLAHLLSKDYTPENRPLLTPSALEDRLFQEGNVPRLPFYRVLRVNLLGKLKDLLVDLSSRGFKFLRASQEFTFYSFWNIISGIIVLTQRRLIILSKSFRISSQNFLKS